MRLNKYDKEAFVSAVMDDVPNVDYDAEAQKIVLDHLKKIVPVELQNMIAKYPDWFTPKSVYMPGCLDNFSSRLYGGFDHYAASRAWEETSRPLLALHDAKGKQIDARNSLEHRLKAAIESCSSLKQAQEVLPEFAKYLPEERGGRKVNRAMPVVTNLVTDLMNAGWPKAKKAPPVKGK